MTMKRKSITTVLKSRNIAKINVTNREWRLTIVVTIAMIRNWSPIVTMVAMLQALNPTIARTIVIDSSEEMIW